MLLVSTAGCNGIQGIFGSDQTTETDIADTPTETIQQTVNSDGVGPSNTEESHTVENTNTDDIVIRLSDLNMDYNFTGGSSEVTSINNTRLQHKQILKQEQRTFVLENQSRVNEQPVAIISVAIIYESQSTAETALQDHLSSFSGSNTSRVEVAGFEGWQTKFVTDDGLRNVAVLGQDRNLVYYSALHV
jgi:hypothetical protein